MNPGSCQACSNCQLCKIADLCTSCIRRLCCESTSLVVTMVLHLIGLGLGDEQDITVRYAHTCQISPDRSFAS